ncbi:GDP-mannose 4,6-dehydratase [Phytohabitans suffuscus]|uniref:GDP-mannose 4,6-dehydratase n=1 Tax=Phytohabitans suffuscus TaxID=624315 RepID=A0A6F8YYF8_9ACTN|nr:GDP-mannose 4,6-dehydratase [Phytohabitans suffuscus]
MIVARTALITGVAGQDGSYLTEALLDSGYVVFGLDRNAAALRRLAELLDGRPDLENVTLRQLDVTDAAAMDDVVASVRPQELYNLAAQSRVDRSYAEPAATHRSIVDGMRNVLEAVRVFAPECRVFQASSCEMFGDSPPPQFEETEFRPVSPYAVAKTMAHQLVAMYRGMYGIYACAGVMFNHESPRRSADFVTRRITQGIALIVAGELDSIPLGNLESRRDWGHARDYVRAMRLMLEQPAPADRVIATGESHSVADFAALAFALVDRDWRAHVSRDPARLRPADPRDFRGNARQMRAIGWTPESSLASTVHEMVDADLKDRGLAPAKRPDQADPPQTSPSQAGPPQASSSQTSPIRVGVSMSAAS